MTKQPVISRRSLLMGLWLAGSSSVWAQVRRGRDQGIGGTGIVGVIQRFGSIFVNGERISYAPNVVVRIDGEPASAMALKIGHLARKLAPSGHECRGLRVAPDGRRDRLKLRRATP